MTEQEKIQFLISSMNILFNKNINSLSKDQLLVDLNLDSLDIVELEFYYEEKTGNKITREDQIVTVNDMLLLMK